MQLTVWKYVYNKSTFADYKTNPPHFRADRVIDDASSVIWCERYQEPGQFEIYMRATPELLNYFADNELLITRADTSCAMIPERVVLKTSAEDGDYLEISGPSAEAITRRRFVEQTETRMGISGADIVYYFCRENIGSFHYDTAPALTLDVLRYMNVFREGNAFQSVGVTDVQPFGMYLDELITQMCKSFDFGFRVRFSPEDRCLYYECYAGTDRSTSVIFARDFHNLGNTTYSFDRSTYYNRAVVAGEGEGKTRFSASIRSGARAYGFTMRETYVDAKNVSSNSDGISDSGQYLGLLNTMAVNTLLSSKEKICFDGEAAPGGQFCYRKDYFLGDKVTVRNSYGITGVATVTEVTEVEDSSGFLVVPQFSEWVV